VFRGVEAFYQARAQFEGTSAYLAEETSYQEAADLAAKGPGGIYYEVTGSDQRSYTIRLCYSGEKFYLGGGTLEFPDFIRLQDLFKQELAARKLTFHRMLDHQEDAPHVSHAATLVAQPA